MPTRIGFKKRFIQDAKSASALDHPNICTIHEIDETDDGATFIAMACYEGGTLRERIDGGPLEIVDAVDIALQISSGLAKAHGSGIVHRDIKPSNIMFTTDGHVKIVDFGIAKLEGSTRLTREGSTLGTAGYMSPEQARGGDIGPGSDVWAVGVILFEMLAGTKPFKGEYEPAVIYSILNERPELLSALRNDIPVTLENLIEKAMEKDPEKRFGDAEEFGAALEENREELASGARTRRMVGLKKFRRNRTAFFGTLAATAAAIILITLMIFQRSASAIDSLAVLPVVDLRGEEEDVLFADGLTAEMISKFARISDWKVIGSSSVKRFRGTDTPAREIGEDLKVKALLISTVQYSGEKRLKMTVEFTRADTDEVLWSDIFERDEREIERLQNEIVLALADEFGIDLSPKLEKKLRGARSVNPEAYRLYLEGRHWFTSESGGSLEKSIEYFSRALEIDSTMALAYAGIADCYTVMACHGLARPHDVYPRARKAINKAMEIDDGLAEVWTPLAHMTWEYDWDTETALKQIDRAIELNPSYAFAHHIKGGILLIGAGRIDEGREDLWKAYELDPWSARTAVDVTLPMRMTGENEEALQFILDLKEKIPDWEETPDLASVYAALGRDEEAITLIEEEVEEGSTNEAWIMTLLIDLYFRTGREEKARAVLNGLEKKYEDSYFSPNLIAITYFKWGESDRGFEWMERAVDERDPIFIKKYRGLKSLKAEDTGKELKDDPRFQALV
ncbi:MAG: protein kinase, partial [Acidobacteriota bacterium]